MLVWLSVPGSNPGATRLRVRGPGIRGEAQKCANMRESGDTLPESGVVLLECEAIGQSFYTGVTFLAQVGAVLV